MPQSYAIEQEVPYDWNIGDLILDRYEVRGIHEGGMGRVYRVYHKEWRTELAVKSPHRAFFENQQQRENFTRECYTWVNLGLHPNIVSCYFVRQLGGVPRIFAEYVEGGTLREWIDSRKLHTGGRDDALARIIDIAIQMAWGLHHAHENGVIHHDVKPGNVLMTTSGTARIADFGLAKARAFTAQQTDGGRYRTILSSVGGMTPAYCSPEQAVGRVITRRTDCWSWALSILDMVLGGVGWRTGLDAPAVLAHCRRNSPTRMPKKMIRLLQQCFQLNPSNRPATLDECAAALTQSYRDLTGRDFERAKPDLLRLTASALNNKGVSLLELGRFADAEKAWEEAREADPHHIEATYNRSLRLWRTARATDDDAVRLLKEIQATHPNSWQPLCLLAQVHLERADIAAAKECLDRIERDHLDRIEVKEAIDRAEGDKHAMLCLRILEGHSKSIRSACISQDGRFAVSGSDDATLRIWDLESGQCLRTLQGDGSSVGSLGLDSQGKLLISDDDDRLRVWDVESGKCLGVLEGHSSPIDCAAIDSRGELAISGSSDGSLRVWEVGTGHSIRIPDGRTMIGSVSLSADGRLALCAGFFPLGGNNIFLLNTKTGALVRVFKGHPNGVGSVVLSADATLALSGDILDGTVKLWNTDNGRCLRIFRGHSDRVFSVALSADCQMALSGSKDKTVRLWDVATGRCLRSFREHSGPVYAVSISKDGRRAISASGDKTLRLWKLERPTYTAPPALSRVAFDSLHAAERRFTGKLEQAEAALRENNVTGAAMILRDLRSEAGYEREPRSFALWQTLYLRLPRTSFRDAWSETLPEKGYVACICMNRDGTRSLFADYGVLKLWEVATNRCLHVVKAQNYYVNAVCLSSDSRLAIAGGGRPVMARHLRDQGECALRVWDVTAGQRLSVLEGHTDMIISVKLSSDDSLAISASADRTVRLWDVATHRCLRSFQATWGFLSADEQLLLSGGASREEAQIVRLWEVATGRCLREFERPQPPASVCLTADARSVIFRERDTKRIIGVYDVPSGRYEEISRDHPTGSFADRRFEICMGADSTLEVWDLVAGHCVRSFEAPEGIRSFVVSPDGRFALSVGRGRVRRWVFDWELEEKQRADWDEGARPFLGNFLTLHMPYAAPFPAGVDLNDNAITMALTRRGNPSWTEDDFKQLLYTLGCAGYGWLRPEGVRSELEKMAAALEQ